MTKVVAELIPKTCEVIDDLSRRAAFSEDDWRHLDEALRRELCKVAAAKMKPLLRRRSI